MVINNGCDLCRQGIKHLHPFVIAVEASTVFKFINLAARIEQDAQERQRDARRLRSIRIVDKEFHDCRYGQGARCNTPYGFDCKYADCPEIKEVR